MKIDVSHFLDTFLQESAEHLNTIDTGLLRLKTMGGDPELLNGIFRAAHSIKGGAGAFGLTHVVKLTHALENLLDLIRNGQVQPTPESISLMLQASDFLKILTAGRNVEPPAGMDETISALEVAAQSPVEAPVAKPEKGPEDNGGKASATTYKIIFEPAPDFFAIGANPLLLLRNLGQTGEVISTRLELQNLPALADLDTSLCFLSWEVVIQVECPLSELQEVFEFVEDSAKIQITPLLAAPALPGPVASAPSGGVPEKAPPRESSIRVATEKIDKVIDLVGEMVIAQAMTSELVDKFSPETHDHLKECVATLERCIRELHERAMSVRMLPVGSIFFRFERLVHDLAQKTGKKIRLVTNGESTEVDRGVLELLGDPLTHLIRNSADHGIETPAERLKQGKPDTGTISLSASHVAGNILVQIEDDGAGLNLDKIRDKAVARGLISREAELSGDEIRALIFEPGLSTSNEISDISGRGVGMDVVKRNVTGLNGALTVMSEEGRGTAVNILLPLTMAIVDGLIVRVANHRFALPLGSIIETVAFQEEHVFNVAGKGEAVRVRDEAIPILRLQRMFKLEKIEPQGDQEELPPLAVVVERGSLKAALIVDELLGQQQLVVKNLEKNFRHIDGAMGATILGDGSAGLILDVGALIDSLSKTDRPNKEKRRVSLVA